MEAILELERLGYRLALDGATLYCIQRGENPHSEDIGPLIREVRQHYEAALSFLQARTFQEAGRRTDYEAEASALLDQMDSMDKLEWCRQWAEVMTRLDAPCTGHTSWMAWLVEVEAGLRADTETESG